MAAGILVERVRQVATEHRALSEVHELANSVRSAEHARVGVDAHDEDVRDGALLEQVEELLSVVGYRVVLQDIDQYDLSCPGAVSVTARLRRTA
jgi:PP-loop superfamily ATP-utilizing enzyme